MARSEPRPPRTAPHRPGGVVRALSASQICEGRGEVKGEYFLRRLTYSGHEAFLDPWKGSAPHPGSATHRKELRDPNRHISDADSPGGARWVSSGELYYTRPTNTEAGGRGARLAWDTGAFPASGNCRHAENHKAPQNAGADKNIEARPRLSTAWRLTGVFGGRREMGLLPSLSPPPLLLLSPSPDVLLALWLI
ncbi:hypothetical protein E2C01_050165 [Portunus trituberculatus]|uniref:Uncharacterized protein n=1 Tax=Portunus trituberculatus TaxID=210409 RepID=A0A5B7GBC1_PORTR|nr:hypothetical protein [Portunus trituberculatus]